jgi:hypothetical protein
MERRILLQELTGIYEELDRAEDLARCKQKLRQLDGGT